MPPLKINNAYFYKSFFYHLSLLTTVLRNLNYHLRKKKTCNDNYVVFKTKILSKEHIPSKGSVVKFSMLPAEPNGRPGADDVFGNKDLMLFMRAKKVNIKKIITNAFK